MRVDAVEVRDFNRIQVEPLTGSIGAEVSGVDLRDVDDDTLAEINQAWLDHKVLFFRDQDLGVEEHKAFAQRFGPLYVHPYVIPMDGHPEVMIIHADASSLRVAGEMWHSDVSCSSEPPTGSILRMFVVPPHGGDTLFASMYAAYEALSPPMQELLGGLTAIHDGGPYYRDVNRIIGRDDGGRDYPVAEHPVVRTHPVTGRRH